MSDAVATPISTAVFAPVASSVRSAGAGASGPVGPALSVALQVIVCSPTVNGPVMSGVAARSPSTMSRADAAPRSTAVAGPVAPRGKAGGGSTCGTVVAVTGVVWIAVLY